MNTYVHLWYFFVLIEISCNFKFSTAVSDGGFGDQFNWISLETGLEVAQAENKPIMVVIHKSWCGACKALKPQFASSQEIEHLSRHFAMVIAGDNDEPQDSKFAADGKYVPRVYFLDSNGNVMDDVYNENGNPSYKFYYHNAETIMESMKKAATKAGLKPRLSEDEL